MIVVAEILAAWVIAGVLTVGALNAVKHAVGRWASTWSRSTSSPRLAVTASPATSAAVPRAKG